MESPAGQRPSFASTVQDVKPQASETLVGPGITTLPKHPVVVGTNRVSWQVIVGGVSSWIQIEWLFGVQLPKLSEMIMVMATSVSP